MLEIGRDKTADRGKDVDEEAAEKLKKDMYVDDGASGSDLAGVLRMIGNMTV